MHEPDETFAVMLTSATNATIADAEGIATILNDDAAPMLSIGNVAVAEGNTPGTEAIFTVTLPWPSADTVTVDFATTNGSAQAGSDYTPAAGTLTFSPGETTQTILIDVHGDYDVEPDETFLVTLSNATNVAIADAEGTGTITNDDAVPPLTITDVTVLEGDAGSAASTFVVTIPWPISQPVTVDFATVNGTALAGSDYDGGAGTLTFNPGQTSQSIVVAVHGDTDVELTESFLVTLSNAANATIVDPQATGTITNDDYGISIGDVSLTEGDPGHMVTPRTHHTSTTLPDGRVLVAGRGSAELFDPATGNWQPGGQMLRFRYVHRATALQDGRVIVTGGRTSAEQFAMAEVFDPATATWSPAGSMSVRRSDHTATLLPDGRVLVAGGRLLAQNGDVAVTYASAEIFDPSTGTWSATGSMSVPREQHQATALADGRVLVSGGRSGSAVLGSAEIYNPATGTWAMTGSMADARAGHVETRLADGRVLVAGGYRNVLLATAETYDPTTGTWSAAGSMSITRYWFSSSAILLPNGRALVTGSWNSFPTATEFFDPATNAWSLTGSLSAGRAVHSMARLLDGRVLVIGGNNGAGATSSAEIYDAATGIWSPAGTLNATFTVTLSPPSPQAVTVDFSTADGDAGSGSDYTAATGSLTFAAGETQRTISILVSGDAGVESDETFFVTLTNPVNAVIVDGAGVGTIVNDDVPPFPAVPVTTPTGSDVVVNLPPATLTFDSVTLAGATEITMTAGGPPPPSGFQLGAPPTYINLATTAAFAGSVQVCIDYNGFSVPDESLMRLFHFDDPAWVDITTSIDTVANVICGETTSFSPFALLEPVPSVLRLPGPMTVEASSASGASVAFTATAVFETDGPAPVVCQPASGSTFPLGLTAVSCSAADGPGNTEHGSFDVTVVDTTAPALNLPAAVTASTVNPAGTSVSFAASAIDLVDGAVAAQCTPGSGSLFPVGATTVMCTAVDSRQNIAVGSFTVSVVLSTPDPTNAPPRLRGLRPRRVTATSPAGAVVKFHVWGVDAEDGRLPAVCSHQSGDIFPIGLTIVSCTTTDSAGATATGRFTVRVTPNRPPKLHGLEDISVAATSPAGAVVKFHVWGLDLDDGRLPAMCSHQSGDIFPIGLTIVSCTTTDSAGATATGTFAVKVHRRFFPYR
jgi:hypothetical protein